MRSIKTILKSLRLPSLWARLGVGCVFFTLHSSIFISPASAQEAQITIGGNVYGGGNSANVDGNTTVTVMGGDIQKVFGGARMANVGGRSFVNIYGEKATSDIFIVQVYGGNDIAGTIGLGEAETTVPLITYYTEEEAAAYNTAHSLNEDDSGFKAAGDVKDDGLTDILTGSETKETNPEKNAIDNTWKAFVRTTRSSKTVDAKKVEDKAVIIGALFGGGNGEYDYEQIEGPTEGKVTHNIYNKGDHSTAIATKVTSKDDVGFQKPEVPKTYLEIKGGSIAHLYGGGNNATVTENTTISINNESDDLQTQALAYAKDTEGTAYETTPEKVLEYLLGKVNLSTFQNNYTSWKFNFARVFGGNNMADMAIQPTWNLQAGMIRDLYSGGNQGRMTSPTGLLLDINPKAGNQYPFIVENVYGGCRMADVRPLNPADGTDVDEVDAVDGYNFPRNLAARTLVQGGDITNVYGGNDIKGKVYFGNGVGVTTSIRGDIYGGGNGAYAYTDIETNEDNANFGDYWYPTAGYNTSVDALNAVRPDAEQVSIMVRGKDAQHPTIIGGSIYLGGNCATLERNSAHANLDKYPLVELKIGSHVIADNVYLGNNGEGMIDKETLKLYTNDYSSLQLTDPTVFANYMQGVSMDMIPTITFEDSKKGDGQTYQPYTSYIGSLFLGGNVGSMTYAGKNSMRIDAPINIFNKLVGGCNNADVPELYDEDNNKLCASYGGGILGTESESAEDGLYKDAEGKIQDRLELNLDNLTVTPLRWKDEEDKQKGLIWNTNKWSEEVYTAIEAGTELAVDDEYYTYDSGTDEYTKHTATSAYTVTANDEFFEKGEDFVPVENSAVDADTRLLNGNIYGGCYNSGHVNGNVVININQDVLKRDEVFGTGTGPYGRAASGVDLEGQRDDVMAVALTVFGGGKGEQTEIWGSATVNLNKGYAFQVFGGGEEGVVGQKREVKDEHGGIDHYEYYFDPAFSTTVNLNGSKAILSSDGTDPYLTETEYIYGGGNMGDVCGNTYVNLGNGRIYDAFGGASDADILGHTEVYIGRQPKGDGTYKDGFPWIRDIVYGGNDFGGTIQGEYEDGYNFTKRVRDYNTDKTRIHGYDSEHPENIPEVLKAATYVEYLQGRIDSIYGGGYGYYNYSDKQMYGDDAKMPYQPSSFVNIRPNANENNELQGVFGGGTGYPKNREGDKSQDRSYILIDIDADTDRFKSAKVFGSGSYNGMGMRFPAADTFADDFDPDRLSAVIDLLHGQIGTVFGGSYNEGVTVRTVVNVPEGSTIKVQDIFGGAYGTQILPPCDVFESNVNYNSNDATVFGSIYGGNNNERRTLYAKVNIGGAVNNPNHWTGLSTVYGAGRGIDTWSEYTEVNLNSGAKVREVYGGGEMGHVLNAESVQQYMQLYKDKPSPQISTQDPFWKALNDGNVLWDSDGTLKSDYADRWAADWKDAWALGDYYTPNDDYTDYATNQATNLTNEALVTHGAEMDDRDYTNALNKPTNQYKYNTNVLIHEGAEVARYAYGGGLGESDTPLSGDIYGNTYIALLGGKVGADIYAAGTSGAVYNLFEAKGSETFIASSNAYIKGGMVRNVYGGGWEGNVGKHTGELSSSYTDDIPGETHVVIGNRTGTTFADGIPAITRNVYGGGEGGSVWGTTNLTINNGMIGYRYKNTSTTDTENYEYVEELDDAAPNDSLLDGSGNAFGGGYIINSYVDNTNIKMYGGTLRGSLFGGGEVGPIGRGTMKQFTTQPDNSIKNGNATIYRAGKTHIEMYNGHVLRNVFGGGRGKDSWGGDGTRSMDPDLVAQLDRDCKGYVFGQTEVDIYGGEIGTDEGMARGFGNVFGGGDEGSVYSAYELSDGTLAYGKKAGKRYNEGISSTDTDNYNYQGYYYKYENGAFATHNVAEANEEEKLERSFTEDCKVLVEPWLQVKNTAITYPASGSESKTYAVGDYIPTAYLNTLKAKSGDNWPTEWENVDVGTIEKERGIHIHNAVFAGGNIAEGSNNLSANTTTVFGNATASIHDVYNRDFITIGTGHTGGLYGDGNLTFVDGYRELNITNYGTDKYHLASPLTIEQYRQLPGREQDYYEPKFSCKTSCTDNEGTTYSVGSELPYDELTVLFLDNTTGQSLKDGNTDIMTWNETTKKWVPNSNYWEEKGVVSTYAGRIMNTIQRADLCGVFGSRMVMKGAQDRVPEIVDYTNYTINRVREVSLNKMDSPAGDTDNDNKMHGNYFGIYSVVNYLGALTSDVDFYETVRTTTANTEHNSDLAADGTTKFAEWKEAHKTDRMRNNGNCHNQLALASGVYLELTTEMSTGTTLDKKDWGLITGVIELDLINVQPGIGGGFVYAKNEHGVRSSSGNKTTTLTALNEGAVTQWDFNYDTSDGTKKEWETSGNFIHSSQTIIDDCYNISNRYLSTNGVPAHYWYVSGAVYVYDQYISAYTGAPNAFSETVEMPITINTASNGKMTLMDVKPNRYAYYSAYTSVDTNTPLTSESKLVINNVTYKLNDPISYWEWNKLPASEKNLFVESTYIVTDNCKIGSEEYTVGTVLLPEEYNSLKETAEANKVEIEKDKAAVPAVLKIVKNENDEYEVAKDKDNHNVYLPFYDAFHSSNNMTHDRGYILTYNVTNPGVWEKWYTKVSSATREKSQTKYTEDCEDGPTYHPTVDGLYGQKEYEMGDVIPKETYTKYNELGEHKPTANQATFVPAYVVTTEYPGASGTLYPGAAVSETQGQSMGNGYASPAYVCTSTIQLSATEYIYINELMTEAEKTAYYNRFKDGTDAEKEIAADINKLIVPAYYCTVKGLYGGSYYYANNNYRAMNAWSSMSETDRKKFEFNYDALDLLIDSTYNVGTLGHKFQYDSKAGTYDAAVSNDAGYSLPQPIDYMATYNGDTDTEAHNGITRTNGVEYKRSEYESLPNEQRHYAPVTVKAGETTAYVIKQDFVHIETPYATGTTISSDTYNNKLTTAEKLNVATLTFTSAESDRTFYYCREAYTIGENKEGVAVNSATGVTGATGGNYTVDQVVPVGVVIDATNYGNLKNYQKNFTIHGVSPMETSTLFVSRNSDINDLSAEKIITVIYKYDYEESDVSGMHVTPVSERHVVNIHIQFRSGVPTVEDIQQPGVVLPGTPITMRVPVVTKGAHEVLGGGWELFEDVDDAESHTNGKKYTPSVDSLYWYQDGYYLAYYAKTYLGKTYSNHVPVSVANYHDLKKVMDDKKYHLHVDYDPERLQRNSKIYINDYSSSSKNALDLFKDMYDLSLLTSQSTGVADGVVTADGNLKDHTLMNPKVEGGKNLEFILRTDINRTGTWTAIGDNDNCFKGNLHGDGHTISGLDNSLFYNLCGSVYNLGVTGSFTSAGVADKDTEKTGYVESCWVKSTATSTDATDKPYAVFGNPTDTQGYQVVNSYFWDGNNALYNTTTTGNITTSGGERGKASAMSEKEFYNGTVAYDLNNFYLYKRYSDKTVSASDNKVKYRNFTIDADNKAALQPQEYHYYDDHADLCSSGYTHEESFLKYVEDRYADGDFIYADGSIPSSENERHYVETVTDENGQTSQASRYFPIWPDDYLFFGQKLTYGYIEGLTHQEVPTAVNRLNGRIDYTETGNRVYRAPAYFRNNTMGVAHFNPYAVFAQTEKLTDEQIAANATAREAYKGMTAIDFTGYDDMHGANGANKAYGLGLNAGKFYAPLLDDDGLTGFRNIDLTRNLLAYTSAPDATTAAGKTGTVVSNYLSEPEYTETPSASAPESYRYHTVDYQDPAVIHGHWIEKTADGFVATTDQLLVDKQDFNAPMGYAFASDKRMWYQRRPDNYVEPVWSTDPTPVRTTKGWEGVSLPFTANLVTTDQKGEITHFYSGSDESKNGTNSKIGHEYWLRKFTGITEDDTDPDDIKAIANFGYPTVTDGSATMEKKTVTNTFLWDYYYEAALGGHNHKDYNSDTYQTYYEKAREYSPYPLVTKATPYLIGFPGVTYYEFDLSGGFYANTTASPYPEKLDAQTITFASAVGTSIGVSDDEMTGVTLKAEKQNKSYTFKPSYLNEELGDVDDAWAPYADGSCYNKVSTTTHVDAFRPYFAFSGTRATEAPRFILFSNSNDGTMEPDEDMFVNEKGQLLIYSKGRSIYTTSYLKKNVSITIVNASGAVMTTYTLEPGKTVITPITNPGAYIVNKKKVFIK